MRNFFFESISCFNGSEWVNNRGGFCEDDPVVGIGDRSGNIDWRERGDGEHYNQ